MRLLNRTVCCTTGFLMCCLWFFSTLDLEEVPITGWEPNVTRNTSDYISRRSLTVALLPKERICDKKSFLLMMVSSAPQNFEARFAIRKTWGATRSIDGRVVSLYFLFGKTSDVSLQRQLQLENWRFGDMIQEDFVDSYTNLTLKSLYMLKIVIDCCKDQTKFVLKIDDDMFLNLPNLMSLLSDVENEKNLLLGRQHCGARPIRSSSNKWYSPRYMFEGIVFPSYLSGTSYLMSVDVATKLFEVAFKTPLFHLEDVYLTGFCAEKAGLVHQNSDLFTFGHMHYDICRFKSLITVHYFTPQTMIRTYRALADPNTEEICKVDTFKFNSYMWMINNLLKPNLVWRKNMCMS